MCDLDFGIVLLVFSDENAMLAGKAGAIDAVVAAMRTHVDHAGVSEQACGALMNICKSGVLVSLFGWRGLFLICVTIQYVSI